MQDQYFYCTDFNIQYTFVWMSQLYYYDQKKQWMLYSNLESCPTFQRADLLKMPFRCFENILFKKTVTILSSRSSTFYIVKIL